MSGMTDSEQLAAAKEAGRQELLDELSYMNDVVSAIMWTRGPVARKIEKELSVIIGGSGYRS